jgi:hypothetical protein
MRLALATLSLAATFLLAGCGVPGAPLPPTLDLAQPPSDLKATRKGDKVTLTWTSPAKTTDGALVKHLGETRVCRGEQPVLADCVQPAGEVAAAQLQPGRAVTFSDSLPRELQQQSLGGFATYAVDALNVQGRSGGLSNQVRIPLAPTLNAPTLTVFLAATGPVLRWRGVASPFGSRNNALRVVYRVRRVLKGDSPEHAVIVLEATPPPGDPGFDGFQDVVHEANDSLAAWEKTYIYWITPVTRLDQTGNSIEVEGDDSAPVEVFVHDTFPPAVPSGVQAVYSGLAEQKFIDLTWAPNTDADLAGYNVYRHEEGAAPVKVSGDPVKTPAFRDANVQPGRTYYYSVSAVDLRGNESAKSAETSERTPQ